ncbi:hypothetical protein BDR07DRAFT_1371648 [Suillus spraguei]|nr:hypothetical protein BDR07DRAFT_1371648 [Suillus spraguei]
MRDIVDILQFMEIVPPQHRAGDDTNSVLEVYDGDHWHDNIDNEFGMFGELLEEEYDGVGACYSQDGSTFLDLFDADEYAECRVDNLYYPFTSKEEWDVADYILRLSLSMAAIDEFLKLSRLDFIPRHIYKTAEQLLHVYLEWLTGDSTWEMQDGDTQMDPDQGDFDSLLTNKGLPVHMKLA